MQYLTDKKSAMNSNTYNADMGWWCRGGEICLAPNGHRDHQEKATPKVLRIIKLYSRHTQKANPSLLIQLHCGYLAKASLIS